MWWARKKDSGNTDSLDDRIRKHDLERVAAPIKASARECVRLKAHTVSEEGIIPLGASKLGGRADLPDETEWPGGSAAPMAFLAQVNTSDLPAFAGQADLPADTLLSFFYDLGTSPRGYHPRDRGGWKVLATHRSASPLKRREIPGLPMYRPCLFTARKDLSLPDPASFQVGTWGLKEDEYEYNDYTALYERLTPKHAANGEHHQLLGYASTIQGDVHVVCHWASQGLYWRSAVANFSSVEELRPIIEVASEWRLLFQVDSDDRAFLKIPNAGRLYYYIRDSDLKAGAFDQVWAVVQIRGGSEPP
jgi:hypothetical protein